MYHNTEKCSQDGSVMGVYYYNFFQCFRDACMCKAHCKYLRLDVYYFLVKEREKERERERPIHCKPLINYGRTFPSAFT